MLDKFYSSGQSGAWENGKIRKQQKSCGYFQLPVVAEIPRHLWGLVNFGSPAWHWCVLGPQPFPLSPPAAYCSLLLPVLHSLAAGLCIRPPPLTQYLYSGFICKQSILVPLFSFLGEIGKSLKKAMLPV